MSTVSRADTPGRAYWTRWIEPWYLSYALLGASVAGMVPILLPLLVNESGSVAQVGIVMAAVSLGGLAAPVWGLIADRYRIHRGLLASSLVINAVGLAAFLLTRQPAIWVAMALFQSIGASGAATCANLFIIEAHPKDEWDERIGWLQTFYGGGQVIGLLAAGVLGGLHPRTGLITAAGLSIFASLLAWLVARTPSAAPGIKPDLLHPSHQGEWAIHSPQRAYHFISSKTVKALGSIVRSNFARLLAGWIFSFGGAAIVFSLYPVLMQQVFKLSPALSSMAFAIAAGLGLALYSPAGQWSERYGAQRVLNIGLGLRLAAFSALLGLQLVSFNGRVWLAGVSFTLVVLAWSLLSVSSTLLVAQISPAGAGESMGIFNASSALAGVLGAALGGWVAGRWGYPAALGASIAGTLLGLIFSLAGGLDVIVGAG